MKKIAGALIIVLLSAILYGSDKRVLVLNSYHPGFHWTDRIMDGIESVTGGWDDVDLHILYMDTKRISDPHYLELLSREYKYKYEKISFDAVLSTDDHALDFLLKYGDDLFPDTPVVFCGINAFEPERIAGHDNFTGIHEDYDISDTLDLITKLHPDRTNVSVILDSTLSSSHFLRLVNEAEMSYSGRLEFIYFSGVSNRDMKKAMGDLDDDDLILWGLHLRGAEGEFLTVEDSMDLIKTATDVPVYAIWDIVGFGVVGGKVARPEDQGIKAARYVEHLLAGETVPSLPVVGSPLVYHFDYRELRAQNIRLASLPRSRIVINKPFELIRENQAFFASILILFLILLIIISFLINDINRRKKAEEQLLLSREQLAQKRKMEAIGQLAGGVAHDFNNLLTGILGAADLIEEEEELSPRGIEYLDMIVSSSRQAADLTYQLLAFGRKGSRRLERLDMHGILDNTLFILMKTINRNIDFRKRYKAKNSFVKGNKSALQNLFMNLCLNAAQAMPEGGEITIETGSRKLDTLLSTTRSENFIPGDYLEVAVSDQGRGIPANKLDKIFEPFYTTKETGSGLGLAAVYGTMEELGGHISVISEEGKGTVFLLYFPQ